jgi:hypothetical protein
MIEDRWGWVPGAFEPFPVYAPALVAFLGGPGAGLYVPGAIGPQVGWFPLAPGETYWPGYTADSNYIRASVGNIDDIQIVRNVMLPAQIANVQFANRRFATVVPQHVFASAGNVGAAARRPPSSVAEHTSVTMRPPQVTPASVRSLPGPFAMGVRGQQGSVALTQSEHTTVVGPAAPSKPTTPPPGTTFSGPRPRPRRATNSAALAPPGHPGLASPPGGMTATPQSFAGQEKHPAWRDATHPRAPGPASHPPAQTFHPQAPAFHPPAQTPQPAQAFNRQPQAPRSPAPASHPPPRSAQQVAHAPQAAKGGGAAPQAPKGGGPASAHDGKGDKHD